MGAKGGWFQWQTEEDFNEWHNALCEQLGLPMVEASGAFTKGHTSCFEYQSVFIAWVDEEYATNLIPVEYIK